MDIPSYLLGKSKGGGGTPNLQSKDVTISSNGTTTITADTGYDGLSDVDVTTSVQPNNQTKSITITENKTATISPDQNYDGLSSVEVITNVSADLSDYMDTNNLDFVSSWQEGSGVDRIIKKLPPLKAKGTSLNYAFNFCQNLEEIESLDTTGVTSMQYMFTQCLKLKSIPTIDTSLVTNMSGMFSNCQNLETITSLDTSAVTTATQMFYNCYKLKNIPILDFSQVAGNSLGNMFSGCPLLTDTSLDNVLQMCINGHPFYSTKTLYALGFRSNNYSVARIQALPHYQDFIDAGWTIGYS